MDKELRELEEMMLSQAIRELLFSFQKNDGDLEYCVKQIREDFRKAGYRKVSGEPPVLSDEEINKSMAFRGFGLHLRLDQKRSIAETIIKEWLTK